MPLYIVGLGVGDERDVTVRGLDAVRRCARVYMEFRTSLGADDPPSRLASLEKLFGKEITVADREMVAERGDQVLREAAETDVAFLVVGHPYGSDDIFRKTTHTDLVVRARKTGVQVRVIDSASFVNAVGACGLELHRYGEAITIPFFTEERKWDQFDQAIMNNRWLGLHTLCILDIQVKEPIPEPSCREKKLVHEPPKIHDREHSNKATVGGAGNAWRARAGI